MVFKASQTRRRFLSAAGLTALAGTLPLNLARAEDLDPESAALNRLLAGPGVTPLHLQSLADVRRAFDESGQLLDGPEDGIASVEDTTTPDMNEPVPVRLYRPDPTSLEPGTLPPVLIYLHGGYFVAGGLDSHDHVARHLCRATRALVVSVGYRLAPEHPYPAPVEDGLSVLRWIEGRGALIGGDPNRIGLCGDNAGATIAASVALASRGAPSLALSFLGSSPPSSCCRAISRFHPVLSLAAGSTARP